MDKALGSITSTAKLQQQLALSDNSEAFLIHTDIHPKSEETELLGSAARAL
jgi:hypothetical protein